MKDPADLGLCFPIIFSHQRSQMGQAASTEVNRTTSKLCIIEVQMSGSELEIPTANYWSQYQESVISTRKEKCRKLEVFPERALFCEQISLKCKGPSGTQNTAFKGQEIVALCCVTSYFQSMIKLMSILLVFLILLPFMLRYLYPASTLFSPLHDALKFWSEQLLFSEAPSAYEIVKAQCILYPFV